MQMHFVFRQEEVFLVDGAKEDLGIGVGYPDRLFHDVTQIASVLDPTATATSGLLRQNRMSSSKCS